ncbi:MAG: IS1595 family transposase [Bacteroidia bacterium]
METKEKYSLADHNKRFPDDESCQDFLREARWSDGPTCPKCKNAFNNYFITKRNLYQCSACRKQFSVLSGTIFRNSQVSLTKWFQAIYFFTTIKKGISSVQLGELVGVTQKTAWTMLQKLRIALENGDRVILNGVVECDEMFFNANIQRDLRLGYKKRKHEKDMEWIQKKYYDLDKPDSEMSRRWAKRGKSKRELEKIKKLQEQNPITSFGNERTIFGMIERKGKLVLKYVAGPRTEEVLPSMITHIHGDAIIMTDEASIYNSVKNLFKGHHAINHKKKKYFNNGITTNSIENAFKYLRKLIESTYCQRVSNKHLQLYLDEHSFRFSNRYASGRSIFDAFFEKVSGEMQRYRDIVYYDGNMAA